jgi:hypothetical protein
VNFTPRKEAPGTRRIGGARGCTRTSLGAVEYRKISHPCRESNPCRTARLIATVSILSLYALLYPKVRPCSYPTVFFHDSASQHTTLRPLVQIKLYCNVNTRVIIYLTLCATFKGKTNCSHTKRKKKQTGLRRENFPGILD